MKSHLTFNETQLTQPKAGFDLNLFFEEEHLFKSWDKSIQMKRIMDVSWTIIEKEQSGGTEVFIPNS